MKKFLVLLVIIFLGAFIAGCQQLAVVTSIEIESETTEFDQNFQLSDLNVKVNMSNGTSSTVPLQESMLSSEDLAKFQSPGEHTISVNYLGAITQLTITITAEPGEDGREVEMNVVDGYIVWRYAGDTAWTNLVALTAITGPAGAGEDFEFRVEGDYIQWKRESETTWTDLISTASLIGPAGLDGKDVTFRVDSGFIQWQYVGDTTWTNLIALSLLVGPAGENGADGKDVTFRVDTGTGFIQWQYAGDTTWTNLVALSALTGAAGATGEDGKAIVLRNDTASGYIQWQYVGDTSWTNLVTLDSLKGQDGKEVAFRTDSGYVQWQYVGEDTWTNLIDLDALKGQDGLTPTIAINQDGYWVINGVVTEYLASGGGTYVPQKLSVTFDLDGGALPAGVSAVLENIPKGDPIDLPVPTKEGYVFKGWFSGFGVNDGQFLNFMPVVKNMTLYAVWEFDTQPIEDLIAIAKSDNFTMTEEVLSTYTVGLMQGSDNEFNQIAINRLGNRDILSHEIAYREYYDHELGKIVYDGYREAYKWYRYQNVGFVYATYDNPLEQQLWNLEHLYGEFYFEFPMEQFDLAQFVKRPGENIYDLIITEEFMNMIPLEIPDGVTYEIAAYVDITLKRFAMEIDMSGEMDEQPVTASVVMSMQFSAVGTTVVEFPEQEAKENLLDLIDFEILNIPELAFASEQSVLEFNQYIDNYKQNISGLGLSDLVNEYANFYYYIHNFEFQIDPLEEHRYTTIQNMLSELEYKKETATADSILNMMAIYDDYVIDINAALTVEAIDLLRDNFYTDLEAAYVFDEATYLLAQAKEKAIDEITGPFQAFMNVLANDTDRGQVYEDMNNFLDQIEDAMDIPTIEGIVSSALLTLQNYTYPVDAVLLEEARSQILYMLTSQYASMWMHVDLFDMAIHEAYELCVTNIENATTFQDLLNVYLVDAPVMIQMFMTLIEDEFILPMLLDEYNALMDAVYDEAGADIVDAAYNAALARLAEVDSPDQYESVFNVFHYELKELVKDELQYYIASKTIQILNLFERYSADATADSIALMNTVVTDGLADLALALNANDVYEISEDIFYQLEVAHEVDPLIMQLNFFKERTNVALYYFYEQLMYFYNGDPELDSLFYYYVTIYETMIRHAATQEDATQYLNEFGVKLLSFDAVYDVSLLSGQIGSMLEECHNMWEDYLVNWPELAAQQTAFLDVMADLEAATTIEEYLSAVMTVRTFLIVQSLEMNRIVVLDIMEDNYNYFHSFVIPGALVELDALYAQYTDLAANATTQSFLWYLENKFYQVCNQLEVDPLGLSKADAIVALYDALTSLSQTATPDSVIAMTAIFDQTVVLINEALDENAIDTAYLQGLSDIENAYVFDTAAQELAEYIEYAKGEVSGVFQSYIQMLVDPLDQEQVEIALNQYLSQLDAANSKEEVDTIFDTATAYIAGLTYPEDPTKLEAVRYQLYYRITGDYVFLANALGTVDPDFDAAYQLLFGYIEAASTYQELLNIYLTELQPFYDVYMVKRIEQFQDMLAEEYVIYQYAVGEADQTALTDLYNEAGLATSMIQDGVEFGPIIQAFHDGASLLDYDGILLEAKTMEAHLYQELEWSANTATADSLIVMGAIVDGALARLSAATTMDELNTIHQTIMEELFAAMVDDENKSNTMFAIEKLMTRVYMVGEALVPFLMEDSTEAHLIWNYCELYEFYMHFAPTIYDAQVLFEEFYAQIFAFQFPFDVSKLTEMIGYAEEEFVGQYDEIILVFGELTPADEALYLDVLAAFQSSTTVEEFLDTAFVVFDFLDQFSIVIAQEEALADMNEIYQSYLGIVIETELTVLNDLYQDYIALLDTVTYEWQAYDLVWEFESACYELEIDPLKQAKQEYSNYLQDHFNNLSRDATQGSIIAMQALVVEFGTELQNATIVQEVLDLYYLYYQLLEDAFVADPFIEQLNYEKEWYTEALWHYTQMMEYTSNDDQAKQTVYQIYYQAVNEISEAIDSEQIVTLYNNFEWQLYAVPFEKDMGMVDQYKEMIINDLFNKSYFYLSQFEEVPAELITKYNTAKNQILQAGNPQWFHMVFIDYIYYLDFAIVHTYRDYILLDAYDLYTKISKITTVDSQLLLDAAYQNFLLTVENRQIKENIDYNYYQFWDFAYNLEYDEVKETRISSTEYLLNQLNQWLRTATYESAENMQTIYSIAVSDIENATDVSLIYDIEGQASSDMWNAYVADSELEALENAIYQTMYELEQYASHTINFLSDNFMWYVYEDILIRNIESMQFVSSESELQTLFDQVKAELAVYEVFDLDEINQYKSELIANMQELMGYVPDPTPYQAVYDDTVAQINNSNHPFEILSIYNVFYDLITP
ncbi:MAG: InlB B-repeat-containing protein [Bacilli bacterium]|jgi:uncharacterized repeat protein (TIGR02543 family)|nr:InlB B-repeat-containing protein [Bacilli bacterium]